MRFRFRTFAVAFACAASLVAATLPDAGRAADAGKQLRRVKGNVGYQASDAAATTQIFGRFDLPDDYFAVTQTDGLAELALPDSSLVTLGSNTRVKVGAFNTTAAGPGSTIDVNGGTLRFNIRRPPGGRANYVFTTPSSQIAVRGTIGLISFINGVTTVSCLQCAADSIVVTSSAQTFTVLTGQSLTVGPAGAATTAITSAQIAAFNAAGLPATVGTGAAAAGGAALLPALGAAAVAGAVIGASVQSNPTTTPLPELGHATPSPTPSPTPTLSPVATSTPTPVPTATATIPGSVTVTGNHRVTPAATPAAAAPATLPARPVSPPIAPGTSPRMGR